MNNGKVSTTINGLIDIFIPSLLMQKVLIKRMLLVKYTCAYVRINARTYKYKYIYLFIYV